MCFWCHDLGHDPNAKPHHNHYCLDKANSSSQISMVFRTFDTSDSTCKRCKVMINQAILCKKCAHKTRKVHHCCNCHHDKVVFQPQSSSQQQPLFQQQQPIQQSQQLPNFQQLQIAIGLQKKKHQFYDPVYDCWR